MHINSHNLLLGLQSVTFIPLNCKSNKTEQLPHAFMFQKLIVSQFWKPEVQNLGICRVN